MHPVPTFRSSCSIAALPVTNFGKSWHWQIYDSSAAFDLKSLNTISPRVNQGLQIGGTSRYTAGFFCMPAKCIAAIAGGDVETGAQLAYQ
jgi:hypothetical protein